VHFPNPKQKSIPTGITPHKRACQNAKRPQREICGRLLWLSRDTAQAEGSASDQAHPRHKGQSECDRADKQKTIDIQRHQKPKAAHTMLKGLHLFSFRFFSLETGITHRLRPNFGNRHKWLIFHPFGLVLLIGYGQKISLKSAKSIIDKIRVRPKVINI